MHQRKVLTPSKVDLRYVQFPPDFCVIFILFNGLLKGRAKRFYGLQGVSEGYEIKC